MDLSLTREQRDVTGLAHRLAVERFATRLMLGEIADQMALDPGARAAHARRRAGAGAGRRASGAVVDR